MYRESRQEKIRTIVRLFYDADPLPDEVVQLILMYAGLLHVGRRSIMWVQFV